MDDCAIRYSLPARSFSSFVFGCQSRSQWSKIGYTHIGLESLLAKQTLDSTLLEVVDRYWARFFGCAPEALRSDTTHWRWRADSDSSNMPRALPSDLPRPIAKEPAKQLDASDYRSGVTTSEKAPLLTEIGWFKPISSSNCPVCDLNLFRVMNPPVIHD
jgi:hypothetical protein